MLETIIFWVHPVTQGLAVLIGLLAMWQGIIRVRMLCGQKVIFPWRNHVRLGTAGLLLWTAGAYGFYVTHSYFGGTHITGIHATLAWPIMGLSILGLITGYIMNKYKKKRFWLPLIHGAGNTVLVLLVLYECWTGLELHSAFMP
ncbi:MAG: hypothetical protein IJD16_00400 [Desulfovibrio sp.]|nr:hypothetical protein [Desulfovibrio sp.]